jgi:hypothetical protein
MGSGGIVVVVLIGAIFTSPTVADAGDPFQDPERLLDDPEFLEFLEISREYDKTMNQLIEQTRETNVGKFISSYHQVCTSVTYSSYACCQHRL